MDGRISQDDSFSGGKFFLGQDKIENFRTLIVGTRIAVLTCAKLLKNKFLILHMK